MVTEGRGPGRVITINRPERRMPGFLRNIPARTMG
ncbi:predicted protein [Streptomyces iranensis]|uniref:Uncharacterized protein n=1 Tax=Streptomyces iranensis TaxID=576784 RepID=A0A061ADF7_9ACTN|nr:predicted protein [Streptomyces iranensis]